MAPSRFRHSRKLPALPVPMTGPSHWHNCALVGIVHHMVVHHMVVHRLHKIYIQSVRFHPAPNFVNTSFCP